MYSSRTKRRSSLCKARDRTDTPSPTSGSASQLQIHFQMPQTRPGPTSSCKIWSQSFRNDCSNNIICRPVKPIILRVVRRVLVLVVVRSCWSRRDEGVHLRQQKEDPKFLSRTFEDEPHHEFKEALHWYSRSRRKHTLLTISTARLSVETRIILNRQIPAQSYTRSVIEGIHLRSLQGRARCSAKLMKASSQSINSNSLLDLHRVCARGLADPHLESLCLGCSSTLRLQSKSL